MTRNTSLIAFLAAFVAGGLIGYALGVQRSEKPESARTPAPIEGVADVFRKAAQGEGADARQTCIRQKLGAERYAALALNPSAATAEDQFTILPCYQ